MASLEQLGAPASRTIAGAGSKTPFRDASRVANEYGGHPSEWAKKSSASHTATDGTKFETHWIENTSTGQQVEFKTKFLR